jgi:hypothetical protein
MSSIALGSRVELGAQKIERYDGGNDRAQP